MNRTACLIGLAVFACDQLTKALALEFIAAQPVAALPFFNFALVWNRGISFGMFSGHGDPGVLALVILSLVITGGLGVWAARTKERGLAVALCAVIAGALGNVTDRVRFGAVVDFLDFHVMGWHYPAFNVADSAIVLGIAFVLFRSIFLESKRGDAPENETPS